MRYTLYVQFIVKTYLFESSNYILGLFCWKSFGPSKSGEVVWCCQDKSIPCCGCGVDWPNEVYPNLIHWSLDWNGMQLRMLQGQLLVHSLTYWTEFHLHVGRCICNYILWQLKWISYQFLDLVGHSSPVKPLSYSSPCLCGTKMPWSWVRMASCHDACLFLNRCNNFHSPLLSFQVDFTILNDQGCCSFLDSSFLLFRQWRWIGACMLVLSGIIQDGVVLMVVSFLHLAMPLTRGWGWSWVRLDCSCQSSAAAAALAVAVLVQLMMLCCSCCWSVQMMMLSYSCCWSVDYACCLVICRCRSVVDHLMVLYSSRWWLILADNGVDKWDALRWSVDSSVVTS